MTQTATAPKKQLSQTLLMKIATAQATANRRPNIRDGEYLFEVRQLLSEQKRKGHCFIIELGVIEAKPSADPHRPGIEPNPVGSICGNVVNLDTNDSAPRNVKRFVLGLLGFDEETMTHEDGSPMTADEKVAEVMATYADLVAPNQPARGMLVRGITFHSIIKTGPNAGKPFVGCNWEYVPDQTDDMIAARRKLIDSGAVGVPLK